ncbi:MAG: NADH:flavin oxidoreductase [Desulfobacterales bacterium]|nr:NADH:flavin oxidoreductase [Desulfobacterales bacterium]
MEARQTTQYKNLFSPISINRLALKNRVVMAPTHIGLNTDEGLVTPEAIDFFLKRAQGGASMLIFGAVAVNPRRLPSQMRLSDDKFVPAMTELVSRIHSESGAKVCAQLYDWLKFGRKWKQDIHDLTVEEIQKSIEFHEKGAIRAMECGFDALEIHAAHGYTLASFLCLKNKREDGYGKDFEGRMRIVAEVYERMRAVVGPDFPLGVRINGDDFIVGGNTLKHSRPIAKRLAEMGLDYISVTAGGKYEDSPGLIPKYECPHPYPPVGGYSGFRSMPSDDMPEAVNVYLAADLRKTLREAGHATPVITAGRIPYPELAESILEEGHADVIALGRPLIRDPDWVVKAKNGRRKEIKRCIYCNDCTERELYEEPSLCQFTKE